MKFPGLEIIASDAIPGGRAYLMSFLGKHPDCKFHTPGRPHLPCWAMARMDFGDEVTDQAEREALMRDSVPA